MKKFTHLLMMLCVFAGTAWAGPTDLPEITTDLENPIYYTIYNTRSTQPGGLMYWAGDGVGMKDGCTSPTLENKYKFYFTGSHDALYVHNAATANKLASVGDGNKSKGSWTDEGTVWAVGVSPKGGGLAFGPKGGLGGNSCWNECNYNTGEGNPDFTTWSANDDGSIFVVELASEFTFPETDKFYTIECPLFESVQNVKKGLYVKEDGALAWGTVDLTNKNHYWVPTVNVDNTVALKNLGTGKYLNGTDMAADEVKATLNALSSTQFNIKVNGTTVHANGHNSGNGAGSNIVSWAGPANSASAWTFVEQEDPDATKQVTIKYSFTYNGEVKYTQETNTLVGQEYPAITTTFPFGVSATKPDGKIPNEGIEEGVKTVEIALSVNLPFVPATDNTSIEHWYYLSIKGNKLIDYVKDQDAIDLDMTSVPSTVDGRDACTWAFVGNPFDGYKLYNKKAGSTMILSSSTNIAGDGATTYPILIEETAVPDGNNTLWFATASTHQTNGFFLAQKGHDSNKMNNRGDKLAYWTGGADNGSTFTVSERDLTGATELRALIDQIKAADYVAGTTVGYLTQASVNAVAQAVTDAETYLAGGSVTAEKSAEHQAAINAAVAALEIVMPEEGRFYVLKCSYQDRYVYVNNENKLNYTQSFDPNANAGKFVWQFEHVSDNKFRMKSVHTQSYMQTITNGSHVTLGSTGADVTLSMGAVAGTIMFEAGNAGIGIHANANPIIGWTNGAGSNHYFIEEVTSFSHTLAVGDSEWSTLVLGYNAAIPSEVNAYVVENVTSGWATLVKVGGVLSANTPIIVNASKNNYEFAYSGTAATVEDNGNLGGSLVNTYVAGPAYVLANGTNGVGLYKAKLNKDAEGAEDSTHFLNNANKAYLPATTAAESRFLVFNFGDDNATAIEGIEAENTADAVVYDLAGRRVQNAQKGVFIVNGKVVIK